jgi:sRNA-binding protein
MASLKDAYASAAATTEQIKREGREESPFLGMFNQVGKDLTEDLKLKNLADPDYEVSDSGAILSMFAPKFRENAFARGLEKQAEIDKQIWFSQAGQRELQAEETRKNAVNLNAAQKQYELKRQIDINGMNAVQKSIGNSDYHATIYEVMKNTSNLNALKDMESIITNNRMARIEPANVTGLGSPILSFIHKDQKFNLYSPSKAEYAKYSTAVKNISNTLREKLNEDSGLDTELLAKVKEGRKLTSLERDTLISNPEYQKAFKNATLSEKDSILNYKPISDQLVQWQKDYEGLHQGFLRHNRVKSLEQLKITTRLYQDFIDKVKLDPKLDKTVTRNARRYWKINKGILDKINNDMAKNELALGNQINKNKLAIAQEMLRIARGRGTHIHKENAENIRQEAWINVQQKPVKKQERKVSVVTEKPAAAAAPIATAPTAAEVVPILDSRKNPPNVAFDTTNIPRLDSGEDTPMESTQSWRRGKLKRRLSGQ